MYIYDIFFIHSSVNGHLGCFYILTAINNSAVNMGCRYLYELCFVLYSLDKDPEVKLLDMMVVPFLTF